MQRGGIEVLRTIALAAAGTVVALGVAAASAGGSPHGFTARVTNPWFPLRPGTRYEYVGVKDGRPSRDVMVVTRHVTTIDGVPCIDVSDRLYIGGRLRERTTDRYTQDAGGNVWYFGEETAELDRSGRVTSTEGSWRAGVDGARPGIFMPARPRVGQSGRQEYYPGHAEDRFRVVAVLRSASGAPVSVLTEETTPLEPRVVDHKLYVRGVGTATELAVRGGDERNQLVSVSR